MTAPTITAEARTRTHYPAHGAIRSSAKEEVEIRERHTQRLEQLGQDYQRARQTLTTDFETRHAKLISEYQQSRETAYSQYENQGFALARAEQQLESEAKEKHDEVLEDAKTYYQHRKQELENEFQERQVNLRQEAVQFQQQCDGRRRRVPAAGRQGARKSCGVVPRGPRK